MNYDEYRQLRAWSWYDGIYLSILWTASFACLVLTGKMPMLSTLFMLIALATPFFVLYRLGRFRNDALGGKLPFRKALFYCVRVFMNAAMLFAIVQWLYLKFIDGGTLVNTAISLLNRPEYKQMVEQMGLNAKMAADELAAITPLQFAATYFVENIIIGMLLSVPIALIMKK